MRDNKKKTGNKLAVETYLTNLEFRAKIFGLTLISVTQKNNFDFNQNEMHFIYGLVNVLVDSIKKKTRSYNL